MILLIDAGNTRIKWRVIAAAAPDVAIDEGALAHHELTYLSTLRARHPGLTRALCCNVAGAAIGAGIRAALAGLEPAWLCAEAARAGIRNHYTTPTQLGADRWAALIGARHLHRHACLVVMAGTATTVDVLDAHGDFLGGLILPGMAMMRSALAGGTAQLPLASGHFAALPRCTADAIESGCLHAQVGAVERLFRTIAAAPEACCLLGGGAAGSFANLLAIPLRRVENLVLLGLGIVATEAPCAS